MFLKNNASVKFLDSRCKKIRQLLIYSYEIINSVDN